MEQSLGETVRYFLIKLNIILLYNIAISLIDVYPNELKTYLSVHFIFYSISLLITPDTQKGHGSES